MASTYSEIEKKSKFTFTIRELGIFLLLLFINLKFTSITIIQNRSMVIDLIVYALFVITFNYSNWNYKKLIPSFLIIGLYTLINFSEFKINILVPLLIIQSVSGIRFKRYLWINLIITGLMLLFMYASYGLGKNMAGWTFLVDRQIRMSFGFNHPNVAAMYYFCFLVNILLLLGYSKFKKFIPIYLIIIAPIWLFVYKKTGSRSFLLSLVILYGSYFYYYLGVLINKKNLLIVSRYVYTSLIVIFSSLTIYFALAKDNYLYLNKILSGRLSLYNKFLDDLTLKDFIFGSSAYRDNIIDSSYLHLLFEGGFIFFILVAVYYVVATTKMVQKKDWIPICVILSFMSYGLMESILLYGILIGSNIFWILLYYYYSNGKMKL